ncbi:hypothetical protein [Galbibacter sp. PAP.153]|uniref:hypothetical protein n=1 Tax=Galbibacter sp. PAP.153 TaxID=3104623 RepID=UPI003009781C
MNNIITIRIYFEYGQKIKDRSFWKKIYAPDFSTELIKRAKALDLYQVLNINIGKGYFNKEKINWGIGETRHYNHPHLIEITDNEKKISAFLEQEKALLLKTNVIIVKNEILVHP